MPAAATEPKPFASLGPMLLARKGTAKPAMRAQLEQSDRVAALGEDFEELAQSQAELGWNDMGNCDNLARLSVRGGRAGNSARASTDDGAGSKAAFTLRLDAERHMRMRLAATMQDCSAQKLVTEALDRFLSEIPELDAIAEKMRRKSTQA